MLSEKQKNLSCTLVVNRAGSSLENNFDVQRNLLVLPIAPS